MIICIYYIFHIKLEISLSFAKHYPLSFDMHNPGPWQRLPCKGYIAWTSKSNIVYQKFPSKIVVGNLLGQWGKGLKSRCSKITLPSTTITLLGAGGVCFSYPPHTYGWAQPTDDSHHYKALLCFAFSQQTIEIRIRYIWCVGFFPQIQKNTGPFRTLQTK